MNPFIMEITFNMFPTPSSNQKSLIIICALLFLVTTKAQANDSHSLSESFFSNMRWVTDSSTRVIHNNQSDSAYMQQFGLDIHTVISDQNKDIGTFTLQTFMVRIDNLKPHPGIFADEHDWALTYRNFNFNYTNGCKNCPNIRIGHFLLPYGLEYTQDTMGQLIDYNHGKNIGQKADWGISLNKQHRFFEYEFGYSLGGGQTFETKAQQRIFSGRIGSLRNKSTVWGLSFVDSKINQIQRQKIAIDLQFYHLLWGYFAEFALGKYQDQQAIDSLFELNWRDTQEKLLLYTQLSYNTINNHPDRHSWIAGLRYEPDNKLSIEAKLTHHFHSTTAKPKPWIYAVQLRYRY